MYICILYTVYTYINIIYKNKFKIYIMCYNFRGNRHDGRMRADYRLLNLLEKLAFSPVGEPVCMYVDPAYTMRVHLQAPFRDARLTAFMDWNNNSISRVRVSVQWTFGGIVRSCFKLYAWNLDLRIFWLDSPFDPGILFLLLLLILLYNTIENTHYKFNIEIDIFA